MSGPIPSSPETGLPSIKDYLSNWPEKTFPETAGKISKWATDNY